MSDRSKADRVAEAFLSYLRLEHPECVRPQAELDAMRREVARTETIQKIMRDALRSAAKEAK